ncbi:MAG: archaeosortase/exosortase family protein, partial [Pirellulales bacterium]
MLCVAALLLACLTWLFCGTVNMVYLVVMVGAYAGVARQWPFETSRLRDSLHSQLPWAGWLALALLLGCEGVALAGRFHARSLGALPGGWAAVELAVLQWARPACAVAVAALLLGGRGALGEIRRLHADLARKRASTFVLLLTLHVMLLALFAWLTGQVLENGKAQGGDAALWVSAWAASAVGGLAAWALCVLPIGVWWRVMLGSWRVLLAAVVVRAAFGWCVPASLWLWNSLATATFFCAKTLLGLVYPEIHCDPSALTFGTPSFTVYIARECSGYEGIGLILVFLLVYLWFDRRALRFPHALVLLPLGAALAFAANAVRLTALVAIGTSWSPEVAIGGFHSQAGWLALNGVALGLVAAAGRLRWFRPLAHASGFQTCTAAGACTAVTTNPVAPYLLPFLGIVATSMLTGAFSAGFDWLYG